MTVFWVEAVLSLLSLAGGKVIKLRDGLWEGEVPGPGLYQGDERRGKVWSRGGQDDRMSLSDTG